jgi:hypothetical protein
MPETVRGIGRRSAADRFLIGRRGRSAPNASRSASRCRAARANRSDRPLHPQGRGSESTCPTRPCTPDASVDASGRQVTAAVRRVAPRRRRIADASPSRRRRARPPYSSTSPTAAVRLRDDVRRRPPGARARAARGVPPRGKPASDRQAASKVPEVYGAPAPPHRRSADHRPPPRAPATDPSHLCITTQRPRQSSCIHKDTRQRASHRQPRSTRAHLMHYGPCYNPRYRTHLGIPDESARDRSCNSVRGHAVQE